MSKIFEIYTRLEVSKICGVSERTVYYWIAKNTMPSWAIYAMGFEIVGPFPGTNTHKES